MTTKYFELLSVCKQISPEVKNRIEKIKPGCIWKNIYGPDGKFTEVGSIETMVSSMRGGNFYSRIGEFEIHFPHSSQIKEILGSLTIAQYVELLGDDYCLFRNGISEIYWSGDNSEDPRFYKLKVSFEPGKELHEQSEEVLQGCIELVEREYGF